MRKVLHILCMLWLLQKTGIRRFGRFLTEKIKNKDFGYEVVKSARFDPTVYYKMNGKEHFFESDFNKFGHDLFF